MVPNTPVMLFLELFIFFDCLYSGTSFLQVARKFFARENLPVLYGYALACVGIINNNGLVYRAFICGTKTA